MSEFPVAAFIRKLSFKFTNPQGGKYGGGGGLVSHCALGKSCHRKEILHLLYRISLIWFINILYTSVKMNNKTIFLQEDAYQPYCKGKMEEFLISKNRRNLGQTGSQKWKHWMTTTGFYARTWIVAETFKSPQTVDGCEIRTESPLERAEDKSVGTSSSCNDLHHNYQVKLISRNCKRGNTCILLGDSYWNGIRWKSTLENDNELKTLRYLYSFAFIF